MKPTTFFVSFLFTSVLALPTALPDEGKGKPQKNQCVQMPDAQRFISRWTGFLDGEGSDIGDAKATAEALVADNFEQYSFSSTSLSGQSVKKPGDGAGLIRKGKQSYIEHVAGSTMKPDEIQTLAALTACDDGRSKIIWHWQFGAIGDDKGDVPVRGFTLLSLVHDDGPAEWKVERIDVEFDSIAWASNADSKH